MGNLTIAYLGNFSVDFTTESHIRETLTDMGHAVVALQENQVALPDILSACRGADLFLWTRTMGFLKCNGYEMLTRIKIPTVVFHLDLYIGLDREPTLDYDPFWRAKYVFTADGDPQHAEVFKAKDINHYWLKPGVLKRECYLAPPRDDLRCDVAFVGSYNYHAEHYRTKLIDFLKSAYGSRFRLFGANGDSWRGHDLNQLYASAKVVVGDSCNLNGKINHYASDRLYESLGRGACTAFPAIPGMTDEFADGVHLRLYRFGDFTGLRQTIDLMLDQSDVERTNMRWAACDLVGKTGTYHNRMQEMLAVLAIKEPEIAARLL